MEDANTYLPLHYLTMVGMEIDKQHSDYPFAYLNPSFFLT